MSILIGFLYVIEVVVCLLLAGIVLLQKPKEGGLGGVVGGGMAEAACRAAWSADNAEVITRSSAGLIVIANCAARRFT